MNKARLESPYGYLTLENGIRIDNGAIAHIRKYDTVSNCELYFLEAQEIAQVPPHWIIILTAEDLLNEFKKHFPDASEEMLDYIITNFIHPDTINNYLLSIFIKGAERIEEGLDAQWMYHSPICNFPHTHKTSTFCNCGLTNVVRANKEYQRLTKG